MPKAASSVQPHPQLVLPRQTPALALLAVAE